MHPDPVSGSHCWHQLVTLTRAASDDRYGDVFVDTAKSDALGAEIIEHGVNGWVCEPNDAAGLARLLHEADRAMRSGHLAQAARDTAERYGMDEMAGRLTELYARLTREAA